MLPADIIPRLPLGRWVESGFDWLTVHAAGFFRFITVTMGAIIDGLTDALLWVPPLVAIALFALIGWVFRSWKFAAGTIVGFLLVIAMGEWRSMMQTMALVLIATAFTVIIAVPLGIWAAQNKRVSAAVRPVLDFMQTMPAFVYLIPAVTFFSIGAVPGLLATIIFSLPPGVRMTELGIRQVDAETVEAAHSFGASKWQTLRGVQLPLAVPTIMAGVNQVIMLALSMAVIAGMVGADGLGKDVVSAISTLNLSLGVEAGLSVVILAIYLDRLTAALGNPRDYPTSAVALVNKAVAERRALAGEAAAEEALAQS